MTTSRTSMRAMLAEAAARLGAAGVESPRVDAELLAAHVLGVPRGRLLLVDEIDATATERLAELVRQRAERVPLQHLTGEVEHGGVPLSVGPGVFVPRPETELLLEWGLNRLRECTAPIVVDLCTGSGVLALAVARARPDAQVHAVELEAPALEWARYNAAARRRAGDTPITVHAGDVTDRALLAPPDDDDTASGIAALAGRADLVLGNPPYVPAGTAVPAEVGEHDPQGAVFAGHDGLAVIRSIVDLGVRLLSESGTIAVEHDETHAAAASELFAAHRCYDEVATHQDLTGRPRFVTARRCA